jgi:23S rRNA (uracil1939-C5)-methyltransferase
LERGFRILNRRCLLQEICSGCSHLHLGESEQKDLKIKTMQEVGSPSFEFHSFGLEGLRSRLDFILSEGKIGLYAKESREIVDIETCLQLEPALQKFYLEFRQIKWPVKKGSVRLRVGPHGERGAWLDFANVDIKNLLESRNELEQLQKISFVEIGQKHKSLIQKPDGSFGLGDPVLNPWFQTRMGGKNISLFSTAASFTQPSHVANRFITETLSQWFLKIEATHVLEFGSGIGNLTFPALSWPGTRVTATDVDEKALSGLARSLQVAGIDDRVNIQRGDFRVLRPQIEKVDVLLLNPARNGVGKFLEQLLPLKPQHIIYMSCFPESFYADIQQLTNYKQKETHLVNQFPNTPHIELLTRLEV